MKHTESCSAFPLLLSLAFNSIQLLGAASECGTSTTADKNYFKNSAGSDCALFSSLLLYIQPSCFMAGCSHFAVHTTLPPLKHVENRLKVQIVVTFVLGESKHLTQALLRNTTQSTMQNTVDCKTAKHKTNESPSQQEEELSHEIS